MPDTQVDLLDWSLQKVHWQILDDVLNNALKYGKKKPSSSQKEFFFVKLKVPNWVVVPIQSLK